MKSVFLVRHGENKANLDKVFSHKVVDDGLTETGRIQADQTGRFLATQGVTAIYCSPLTRAVETAEALAARLKIRIQVLEELRELDVGDLDGKSDSSSWEQYFQTTNNWYFSDGTRRFPNGENYQEMLTRFRRALTKVLSDGSDGKIAVFGHGGIFTASLIALCGISDVTEFVGRPHPHGSITELLIDGSEDTMAVTLRRWADSSHMSGKATAFTPGLPVVDALYRAESRRVLATLVRLLGDLDLAEEALHEAFAAALEQWPREGIPTNPRAWLVSTGRFKVVDAIRRRARRRAWETQKARGEAGVGQAWDPEESPTIEDDRLRLIFLCCHPVNPVEAQVALTLREVCGLSTEQIAAAYLVEVPALAKRIVRAKARLRDARIPYEVPAEDLPARLGSALQVVYLVFHEGYSASSGPDLVRAELSAEAIRLGRLLAELDPRSEVLGLLALMLLQESRRTARLSVDGELLLLDEQDRSLWNPGLIAEGLSLVDRALVLGPPGLYVLQAAIAALHAQAAAEQTDWPQVCALYDLLLGVDPSPVVALNRAVAVGFRDGPAAGLRVVDDLLATGALADYHLLHSVRADFLRRLDRRGEARLSYEKALYSARQETERRFLHRQLRSLGS